MQSPELRRASASALDAASLLICRDGPRGPQLYMLRRHPSSRFMAKALVFVGGRFDEADAAPAMLACCSGPEEEKATLRLGMEAEQGRQARGLYVTAIRECFEESGLLIARRLGGQPFPGAEELTEMRRRLLDGSASLAELCQQHQLQLPLESLRFLDHWITPELEPRRFNARFFVCRAPDQQRASVDSGEATLGGWFEVEEALRANQENRLLLPPPTLTILEGLRGLPTVGAILAAAPDRPLPATQPRPLPGSGQPPVLLLPGDHRFDDPSSASGAEHFVVLAGGHWSRVRRELGDL